MNPKKLIEVLNRVLVDAHGPFQVILIVNTHTNQMNDTIKNEIIDLFSKYRSFAMYRQFKNSLFITYSDGRYGYEAYAQLNNHHLENNDLIIQVKVENEQYYSKLIEQEIMDCLMSINLRSENGLARLQEAPQISTPLQEVEVGNLLGDSFTADYEEKNGNSNFYMNVPTQLHSNLSFTNNLHTVNTNKIDSLLENDSRHQYHNPMIKALSNSNLTMFDQPINFDLTSITHPFQNHQPKVTHSAANLLDSLNDEVLAHASLIAPPPRRPPPPQIKLFQQLSNSSDTMPKSNSFGFEDDFSSFPVNKLANSNNTVPARPPPLPPMSAFSNPPDQQQTPENGAKPSFNLFDDSFDSNPFSSPIVPSRPPPLPPMQNQLSSSNTKTSVLPPPLPPMPSRNQSSNRNTDFFQLADLDISSNSNSTNAIEKLIDFDLFTDSISTQTVLNKPLPPPRPNHFK